jgi:hypothetical protein
VFFSTLDDKGAGADWARGFGWFSRAARPICFLLPWTLCWWLAGCGSSSQTHPQPQPQPIPLAVTVTISPATANVVVGQTQHFTATVIHTSNTAVRWSVKEGAAGGVVDNSGNYAAVSPGVFHVIATSREDTSKSATAAVTAVAGAPPKFSSVAPTTASEAEPYSYKVAATDPSGGTVSFAITRGPANASIAGTTLSWTPSHAQSRVANSFTITAATSEGASAIQTFSVIPTGNVDGLVNTAYYDRSGTTTVGFDLSASGSVTAYVPNSSGGFTAIAGTGNSDGTFTIASVPAGNYWLAIGAYYYGWTDQSDPVLTGAQVGRPDAISGQQTLQFNVSLNHALQDGDGIVWYSADAPVDTLYSDDLAGSAFCLRTSLLGPLLDASKGDQVFLNHLQSTSVGTGSAAVITESWNSSSITETSDGPINVTGAMTEVPTNATVRLNIKGSQFAALDPQLALNGIQGRTSILSVLAQPYGAPDISGAGTFGNAQQSWVTPTFDTGAWAMLAAYADANGITTDSDQGNLNYGNPFASDKFAAVLQYSYNVAGPTPIYPAVSPPDGGVQTTTHTTTTTTSVPQGLSGLWPVFGGIVTGMGGEAEVITAPGTGAVDAVEPIIGPVLSTKVNGQSFSSGTLATTLSPTISWMTPSLGTPDRYIVSLFALTSSVQTIKVDTVVLGYNTNYNANCCLTFTTTSTSIAIPPGVLQDGTYYALDIEADSFNKANPSAATVPVGYSHVRPGVIIASSSSGGCGSIEEARAKTTCPGTR